MNVRELIDMLQGVNGDTEVRFASQPNWPFEYAIADVQFHDPVVITREALELMTEDEQEACEKAADNGEHRFVDEGEEMPTPIVYLVEGRQLDFLPTEVRQQIGW